MGGDATGVLTRALRKPFIYLHGTHENPFSFNDFQAVACESKPKGVQTQRRRVFDAENRRLRGQKGMVDAGESPKPATAAQF